MTVAIHGHNHTVDTKTGFLQSQGYLDAFDAKRKEAFLAMLADQPFKLNTICQDLGLSKGTVYKHLEIDQVFRECVLQIKDRRLEAVEQKLADMALKDEQVADRIFFLKSWKPERYNPVQKSETKVEVSVRVESLESARERVQVKNQAIDTQGFPTQITSHSDNNIDGNTKPIESQTESPSENGT